MHLELHGSSWFLLVPCGFFSDYSVIINLKYTSSAATASSEVGSSFFISRRNVVAGDWCVVASVQQP